jgi:hypothetical protein
LVDLTLRVLLAIAIFGCGQPTQNQPAVPMDTGIEDAVAEMSVEPPVDLGMDLDLRDDAAQDVPPDTLDDSLDDADTDADEDTAEDSDEPLCVPEAEVCDGQDNDCDGFVDETESGQRMTEVDPRHCGGCGLPCDFSRAAGRCVAGECVVDTCEDGALDLDETGRNGCEVLAGAEAEWDLTPANIHRVIAANPWFFVLDGRVVWMHLESTGELVDHVTLPGAVNAAWHADRSLLVVAGLESVSVLEVDEAGIRWNGFVPAPRDELHRVVVQGDYAYVANDFNRNRDSRLWVVDISDPSHPFVAHREGTLRGTSDIALLDAGHLVTVSVSLGLSVYSLANPARPFLLSFDDRETWPSTSLVVDRERRLAFAARRDEGVNIFDVSDPEQVRKVGVIHEFTPNQSIVGMMVQGTGLWTADLSRIRMFDVSNPATPRRQVSQSQRGAGQLLMLTDKPALVLHDGWGDPLSRWNLSHGRLFHADILPTRLVTSGVALYSGEETYGPARVYALGNRLLTAEQGGLMALHRPEVIDDVLDPGPPVWTEYTGAYDLHFDGDLLYGAASTRDGRYYQEADLVIWRLDEPGEALVEVGRGTFPCEISGVIPYDLSVAGGRAYVMCGSWSEKRVQILNVEDPSEPQHLGTFTTPVGARHIVATENQLVVGSERRILYRTAVQIAGYARPVTSGDTPTWRYDPSVIPFDFSLHQGLLYLWSDGGSLDIMDIGVNDGFVPVEGLTLAGVTLAGDFAPHVSEDLALLATSEGIDVLGGPRGQSPHAPPTVLGRLSGQPVDIVDAVMLPQGAVILDGRRMLTISVTHPD